ncbi:MAG: ORF6N domain-containing protein [Desulfobacterales bacterium]
METKRLKEQVRRDIERFPNDFMFELTKEELRNWVHGKGETERARSAFPKQKH